MPTVVFVLFVLGIVAASILLWFFVMGLLKLIVIVRVPIEDDEATEDKDSTEHE